MRTLETIFILATLVYSSIGLCRDPHSPNQTVSEHTVETQDPKLPPLLLYHGGRYDVLIQDINAPDHLISPEAWKNFIMGDKTNWALPPFRRGLYGGTKVEIGYNYAAKAALDGFVPWMAWLHLKDTKNCRDPKRIFYASEFEMNEKSAFYHWLKEKPRPPYANFDAIKKDCFLEPRYAGEVLKFDGWPFYNEKKEPGGKNGTSAKQPPEPNCQKLLNQYVEEKNFAFGEDTEIPNSWYIRDENCVAKINGSPEEYLQVFRKNSELFNPEMVDDDNMDLLGLLILKSLAASKVIDPDALRDLSKTFEKDPIKQNRADDRADLWKKMRPLIKSATKCVAEGHTQSFQKNLTTIVDGLSKLLDLRTFPNEIPCP